jgi:predicted nucleotidyltransferase
MDRAEIESRLRGFFEADPRGAKAVYLFGSFGRDEATGESDVDVAVLGLGRPRTLEDLPVDLQHDLEEALGRPVHVIPLECAPVDLVHRVLRDGRLVLDRDRTARIRFEVRARNEYFDLEPHLRRYRKSPAAKR